MSSSETSISSGTLTPPDLGTPTPLGNPITLPEPKEGELWGHREMLAIKQGTTGTHHPAVTST